MKNRLKEKVETYRIEMTNYKINLLDTKMTTHSDYKIRINGRLVGSLIEKETAVEGTISNVDMTDLEYYGEIQNT